MKLIPSESSAPTQLLSRQHFVRISPLAATLMDLPASVADNRLTARLSPLAATLTKNRGVGVLLLTKILPRISLLPAHELRGERILRRGLPSTLQQETSAPLCPLLLQSSGTRTAGPNVSTL